MITDGTRILAVVVGTLRVPSRPTAREASGVRHTECAYYYCLPRKTVPINDLAFVSFSRSNPVLATPPLDSCNSRCYPRRL
jgi:hypothetical protein